MAPCMAQESNGSGLDEAHASRQHADGSDMVEVCLAEGISALQAALRHRQRYGSGPGIRPETEKGLKQALTLLQPFLEPGACM